MQRRTLFQIVGGLILQACGIPVAAPTPSPTPPVLGGVIRTPGPLLTHQLIECEVTLWPVPADRFAISPDTAWLVAQHDQQTLRVPVFWSQEFAEMAPALPVREVWLARLHVAHAGEWRLHIDYGDQQSAPWSISVDPHPTAKGFVNVSGTGFAYADDSPFLPIGVNLGWSTSHAGDVLADYARWFVRLAANGGTVARIWMASWSFAIEWNDTPLGDYTARMPQAWLLDEVLRLADAHGIVIMLCLVNHGAFSQTTNAEWEANPYNQANGGPLTAPEAFVTDPTARVLFAKRVRYIAARYAAYPALWCWEWWNEVNWTPITDADLAPWLQEMRAVLAEVDPYQHPVTSSWSSVGATTLWESASLDIVQHHTYNNDDLVRTLNADRIPVKLFIKSKPFLISEVGLDARGATVPSVVERVHLDNAVWAPVFLGMAGTGMYWWWDTWLDPTNQWDVFAGVSEMVRGLDLRTVRPFTALLAHTTVLGLKNDTTVLLWLRHARYTARDAMQAYQQLAVPPADWQYQCVMAEWQTLALKNLADGAYACSVLDPVSATWQATSASQIVSGAGSVAVPPFVNHVAIRMVRM